MGSSLASSSSGDQGSASTFRAVSIWERRGVLVILLPKSGCLGIDTDRDDEAERVDDAERSRRLSTTPLRIVLSDQSDGRGSAADGGSHGRVRRHED